MTGQCAALRSWVLAALVGCCAVRVALAEEEEGPPITPSDKSMAMTLLGSICFMMSLYYLTNWPDQDIRQYTYEIISATISIFCAVLTFQSFNDLLNQTVQKQFGEVSPVVQFFVGFGHQLFWYTVLQVFLAYCSGAAKHPRIAVWFYVRKAHHESSAAFKERRAGIKSLSHGFGFEDEHQEAPIEREEQDEIKEGMEANMKCFAVLLAHMTGFASINAWGCLQHLPWFEHAWWASFLAMPSALVGQMIIQRITDSIRRFIATYGDDNEDDFEKMWDEECEEAENDIMGLTLSFLMVQSVRYYLNGELPNVEGAESEEVLRSHTVRSIVVLAAISVIYCLLMFLLRILRPDKWEKKNHEADSKKNGLLDHEHGESHKAEEEEEEETTLAERYYDCCITVLGMSFAWCWFYAARAAMATQKDLEGEMLAIIVALAVSFVSFAAIFVLDKLADADWTGPKADEAIKQVIGAMAILIGFAWEQSFDLSVDALSEDFQNPHAAKLILGLVCVLVVVPAWRLYMLPMVIEEGWAAGFIINEHNVNKVIEHIKNKTEGATKGSGKHEKVSEVLHNYKRQEQAQPNWYALLDDDLIETPDGKFEKLEKLTKAAKARCDAAGRPDDYKQMMQKIADEAVQDMIIRLERIDREAQNGQASGANGRQH